MNEDIVVAKPSVQQASQLILLFHGVGGTMPDMVPLGELLLRKFPNAYIVAGSSAHPSDLGGGRQGGSVRDINEENRAARIAEAMPRFLASLHSWQQRTQLGPRQTILIGFSQGAIMSLAASLGEPMAAARVIAIAGRFAALPADANRSVHIHLVHGALDQVIATSHAQAAHARLQALGVTASLDVAPQSGHGIDQSMARHVLERLAEQP